jgi:hypothetical protein
MKNTVTQMAVSDFPPWLSFSLSLTPPPATPRSSPISFSPTFHFFFAPDFSETDLNHRRYFPNEGETLLFSENGSASISLFSRPYECDDTFLNILNFRLRNDRLEFLLKGVFVSPLGSHTLVFRVNYLESFLKAFLLSIKHVRFPLFSLRFS